MWAGDVHFRWVVLSLKEDYSLAFARSFNSRIAMMLMRCNGTERKKCTHHTQWFLTESSMASASHWHLARLKPANEIRPSFVM